MGVRQQVRRIGILTGGGDCPGLNAVIRAVAKTAMKQHGWEVFGIEDGYLGLIENRIRPLGDADVSNILTRGGTILGSSNKADPSRFRTDTDAKGQPVYEDVSEQTVAHAGEHKLDVIVCIGGDGTMTGAANLIRHGLRCVGVPKTIDNDLMHTEITFGFDTAVGTATDAIDRIHTTAASHHRVMIVETMGRNAGWLALHSGIAGGADVILIPEIPYDAQKVGDYCIERFGRGKSSTIISISEGARPVGGKATVKRIEADSPDPIRLGGVSQALCRRIGELADLEARATILGHVQRGGTPSAFDRVLATQLGHAAVELIAGERMGRMVVVQKGRITDVEINAVADRQRLVPVDHPLIRAARAVGTCFGD